MPEQKLDKRFGFHRIDQRWIALGVAMINVSASFEQQFNLSEEVLCIGIFSAYDRVMDGGIEGRVDFDRHGMSGQLGSNGREVCRITNNPLEWS